MPYREPSDSLRATRVRLERARADGEEELALLSDPRVFMPSLLDRLAGGARRLERSLELPERADPATLLAAARRAHGVEGLALPHDHGVVWGGRPEVLAHHQAQVRIDLASHPPRATLSAEGGAPWHLLGLLPLLLVAGATIFDGSHPIAAALFALASLAYFAHWRGRYMALARRRALGLHRCARAMQRGSERSQDALSTNEVRA